MRPFDLLQLPIEPIASPWTPPTRHVAAWPGVVYQRARNQAKTPETHVQAAPLKASGGPAWLRTWRSRTYYFILRRTIIHESSPTGNR